MSVKKNIALVAHDNRKQDLIEWVLWNYRLLLGHNIISTGTTGSMVKKALDKKIADEGLKQKLVIKRLKSGPLGGDQQLGALIAEKKIDVMFFFWDPMQPLPHDVDVKALLRISVVYNIPIACNRATADYLISSPLLNEKYVPKLNDYSDYIKRSI